MITVEAPSDLGTDGGALLRRVREWLRGEQLVLDPHEQAVLIEACRVADRLAQLRAALVGLDLVGDPAAVRLLAEERQQRGALAGLLLTKLGLPTGLAEQTDTPGTSPRSRRAQKAARARWGGDGAA